MSNAMHTPGPWTVTRSGSGEPDSLLARPDNGKPYIEHAHVDGPQRLDPRFKKGVAVVYLGDGWGPNGDCDGALAEQEANAHLIAAAPDLLAAARIALNNACLIEVRGLSEIDQLALKAIADAASAAISKAKGGAA